MQLDTSPTQEDEFNFLVDLENAWAWDRDYWNLVSANCVRPLDDEQLELARQSLIRKLERIEKILREGLERSDDEIMLTRLSIAQRLLHPIKVLKVLGQKADTAALRSEQNLKGIRHNFRYILVQIVETQRARGLDTEGIPEHLDGDDIPGFKEHFAKIWLKKNPK